MKAAVSIDDTRLDKECVRLPELILRAGVEQAEARRSVDEAKRRLEAAEASFRAGVRSRPGKHGIEKVTEAAINEAVLQDEAIGRLRIEVDQAKELTELYGAYCNALEAKKRSLTLLVDLHGQGYFASVRPTQAGRASIEKEAQREVRTRKRLRRQSEE